MIEESPRESLEEFRRKRFSPIIEKSSIGWSGSRLPYNWSYCRIRLLMFNIWNAIIRVELSGGWYFQWTADAMLSADS